MERVGVVGTFRWTGVEAVEQSGERGFGGCKDGVLFELNEDQEH